MTAAKGILCYKGEDVIELMIPQGTKLKEIRIPSSQQITGTVWDVYIPVYTGDYVFSYSILTIGEMGVKKRYKKPVEKVKAPKAIGDYYYISTSSKNKLANPFRIDKVKVINTETEYNLYPCPLERTVSDDQED